MKNYTEYIENHTLRCEASYRGGGIEIDCSEIFPELDEPKMTAFQNYLGGGMLGAISSSCNFIPTRDLSIGQQEVCEELADSLKRYFHEVTNHGDDEWESSSYEDNQKRATSAY